MKSSTSDVWKGGGKVSSTSGNFSSRLLCSLSGIRHKPRKPCVDFWKTTVFIHTIQCTQLLKECFFTYRIRENKNRKYGPFCCQIPQKKTTKLNFEKGRISARKGFC